MRHLNENNKQRQIKAITNPITERIPQAQQKSKVSKNALLLKRAYRSRERESEIERVEEEHVPSSRRRVHYILACG